MSKTLILVNGTMGVGKTSVCQLLKEELSHTVFLDGDWAWDMSPFIVNDITKQMVMNNISYCLNQFIESDTFEYIICCWVLHEQSIIDDLVSRLNLKDYQLKIFTLMADEKTITAHIKKDVQLNKRTMDVLQRSIDRLKCYENLNTIHIDVSCLNIKQTADAIIEQLS